MEDTCVCCGEYIPEGRMVCYSCEKFPHSKAIISLREYLVLVLQGREEEDVD